MTELVGDRRTLTPLPGGGYKYAAVDEGVRVECRYLRRERGQLHAEVDVQCDWAGALRYQGSLSCADMNLSSQMARKSLGKYCAERARTKPEAFDWVGLIEAAARSTIQAERDGDPIIVLDDAPVVPARDIEVLGLQVPLDGASLLIAHGDSLKSLITLLVLGTLARNGRTVLYLDWEWTADRHLARKCRLFGPDRLAGLHYFRCRAPLVVEADHIRRYCDRHGVSVVAVDSVGLACDGKLVDDDVAVRFYRALGTLPAAALCAAHVPKSALAQDPARGATGPFGSVYFSNLCRMSWLVKKQPGASEDLVTVGLFPEKQNDGARRRPVGLEFTFGRQIDVRPVDLATVEGLAEKLPLSARITHVLAHGPMTYVAIAEELGAKVDSVIQAVRRGSGFIRVPGPGGVQQIGLVERRGMN